MTPCLLIATRNAHKVAEIQAILGDTFRYATLRDLPESPEVAETGDTFDANARLKAEGLAGWIARHPWPAHDRIPRPTWVLADDSGLEVDALGGAPGVQSARFASPEFGLTGNAPDGANNAKLLRLLAPVPAGRRTARFRCVLALTPVQVPPPVNRRLAEAGVSPAVEPGVPPGGPSSSRSMSVTREPRGLSWATHTFDGTCEGTIGFVQRGEHGFGYDPLFIPVGFDQTLAQLGDATKNRISHRSAALAALKTVLPSLLS